ncbi:hypothetical protein [Colwellia sp. E2M01]|uniref:hypothetical protein n=1 Tax=Colwellia sp. E2M01 TaxID=2841561 RepID=UPI001C0893CD|nr:hypothetical protein [Colwellia sp. E2M01]MBU2870563.1 hypothetical protein [Colwellia sp. E2M01]
MFSGKEHSWFVEIAEDQAIEAQQLPLVGFGCAGWLYQVEKEAISSPSLVSAQAPPAIESEVKAKLNLVFKLFTQNKLVYIPAVTCCND